MKVVVKLHQDWEFYLNVSKLPSQLDIQAKEWFKNWIDLQNSSYGVHLNVRQTSFITGHTGVLHV